MAWAAEATTAAAEWAAAAWVVAERAAAAWAAAERAAAARAAAARAVAAKEAAAWAAVAVTVAAASAAATAAAATAAARVDLHVGAAAVHLPQPVLGVKLRRDERRRERPAAAHVQLDHASFRAYTLSLTSSSGPS